MNRHLNEEEFADLLAGNGGAESGQHVKECERCRREVESFTLALAGLRMHLDVTSQAHRPTLEPVPGRAAWRRQLAYAVAALLLLALFLVSRVTQHPVTPEPVADAHQAQPLSDEALFSALENDLSRRGPTALSPAAVLTDSRKVSASASFSATHSSTSTKKAR